MTPRYHERVSLARRESPRIGRWFAHLLLAGFFFTPLYLSAADCLPPPGSADEWQLDSHDLDTLQKRVGKPQLVRFHVGVPSDGEGRFQSIAHMHALFDTPIEGFAGALEAVEDHPEFMNHLKASDIVCSEPGTNSYLRLEHQFSFRFLIFRRDYRYVINYFIEDDIDSSRSFRVWWDLYDTGDGQIVKNSGSWYLEEVEIDGDKLTYVAYAVHTVFSRRRTGLGVALRRFGKRNVRAAMRALRDEAQSRAPKP